jgi:UDP-N-acetylglucosamine diphosphorylase / glucose-1-phosphate thymidylyltransferase / UDP-N-acetylgalactosamine diphosphorylase / glucosamine-1-phosphate N-acetyltransferase / galactosamine-1-phosphate N-acetyltransferase
MIEHTVKLQDMKGEDIPADFKAETYFDLDAHPFKHRALFKNTNSVCAAIENIGKYSNDWLAGVYKNISGNVKVFQNTADSDYAVTGRFTVALEEDCVFKPERIIGSVDSDSNFVYVCKGVTLIGATLYLDKGSIYIGENTIIEPQAGIRGPAIIGRANEIRQSAYLRGKCITGNNVTLRGEVKNSVFMDKATFPHPSYVGDSLCGYMSHFGNQATTANIGIFAGLTETKEQKRNLIINCGGTNFELSGRKMGVCMGDYSQLGCNSVTDPGTFLKPYTITYSLTRISKGFYGPYEILKNKPLEHGVIERAHYQPQK